MIAHMVMLSLRPEPDRDELLSIMDGLARLTSDLDGFEGFEHGENIDVEGKSQDYPYGFLCRFRDRAALEAYAADPRHRALGARLVALCKGGGDGIMVVDLDTGG